jgi:phospholipid N-methyltransferase
VKEALTFLKEFACSPTQVGAIAPSSPGLVAAMVDWLDWSQVRGVVELGPGTGVFTEAILARLPEQAKFVAIERSPAMVELARVRCPAAEIVEDSATNLATVCEQAEIDAIDAVICGLPWASLPDRLQSEIMGTMLKRMRDGAAFASFAYWQGVVLPAGRRFSRRLKNNFRQVDRSPTVWRNLPPAFVYRCRK